MSSEEKPKKIQVPKWWKYPLNEDQKKLTKIALESYLHKYPGS